MTRKILLTLVLLYSALNLCGCFDASVDEQSVPWGRPADWERGAPGFGGY